MTGFDISTAQHIYYGGTEVQSLYLWSTKIWPSHHDYSQDYLTFEALENTTFTFTTNDLQYSLDNGTTWTTLTANTASPTVTAGNKILWKQNGLTPGTTSPYGIGTFSATGNFNASGNIMSLYYGDNFIGQTDLTGKDYAFYGLFFNCTKLVSAENLILPPTTLSNYCYRRMFYGCTALITAPELPTTTLARDCYSGMFNGCTSLTTAPELPATTLANNCYENMFNGCTSLTTAPELPATTLANSCYGGMFNGCTALNYIKCLATDNSAINCTYNWVQNVSPSGIFVKNASMSSWTSGINGIPTGWTVQDDSHNYSQDYFTIVSLEDDNPIYFGVKDAIGAQTISVSADNGNTWTQYTSSEPWEDTQIYGTLIGHLDTGEKLLIKGNNTSYSGGGGQINPKYNYFCARKKYNVEGNIMSLIYGDNFLLQNTLPNESYIFQGLFYQVANPYTNFNTVVSAENLILPATTLQLRCYCDMFHGCKQLTTAPVLPATTLAQGCYCGMFALCEKLTQAPILPATTLVTSCYEGMFKYCDSLNYIKCLAIDAVVTAHDITASWVDGVSATGTFIKDVNATWPTGVNGIPSGWNVIDDYSQEYLTFEALESGNITWKAIGTNSPAKTISYSKNNGTWTSIASSSAGTNISVSAGDKVRFKGSESSYATSKNVYSGFENQSGAKFNIYGNIMSLIYGDNFIGQTSFNGVTYNLCSIFKKSNVVSAENLILPATTLTNHCYRAMFSNATLLEKAPKLPATTLAEYCYYFMFESTKITTAPELPATILANYCYGNMFKGCSSLTTAPELHATTLAYYCYQYMFQNCSSLTTAPTLPATTLAQYCYQYMFNGCTSLNYIKCLATDTFATGCTRDWVRNVAATGTFVKNPAMQNWSTGNSGIPSGWIVQNT